MEAILSWIFQDNIIFVNILIIKNRNVCNWTNPFKKRTPPPYWGIDHCSPLGWVVQKWISANPGLKVKQLFFFTVWQNQYLSHKIPFQFRKILLRNHYPSTSMQAPKNLVPEFFTIIEGDKLTVHWTTCSRVIKWRGIWKRIRVLL